MDEPVEAFLGGLDPQRVGVDAGQHPPDPFGDRPGGLGQHGREQESFHGRARGCAGLGQLGGDDRGPPRVKVSGAHRGQRAWELGGQRRRGLDLAAGRDRPHGQRRPERVGGELADMAYTVVDLDPRAGAVLFFLPGGVLGDPQRLDCGGRVDHLLGAVDCRGKVDTGQVGGAALGVREGLTHQRECLRELVEHVF